MDIKDIVINQARRKSCYCEGEGNPNNSCKTCMRKHMSFPYTCNDGWPIGNSLWVDRGDTCINWTDKSTID